MEKQIEMLVTKKLEQFYCSILVDEAKKIDLVKANVVWKCKLPGSQGR
jgi:hypothetical protein